jgi:CHAD domain-containing protein
MEAYDRAGDVVLASLRAQAVLLEELDPKARRDDEDAVHRMRATTRRLRSALATFAPLLDRETGDRLRAELNWLSGVLGTVRDAEVMRDRLLGLATDDRVTAPSAVGGAITAEVAAEMMVALADELEASHRAARVELLEVLGSDRHLRLVAALDTLVHDPPWTRVAERPARTALSPLVHRDWRRVEKRARTAAGCAERAAQEIARHELRKAAKRLRYGCEAVASVFGPPAVGLGAAAEHLQDVLGEHHDSVVSQQVIRRLGGSALLDRLLELEQQRELRAEAGLEDAWRAISEPRLREWLVD